ncbi:acyl carrier protein [Actibacterium sp.]|uniref:acyl carrier protein n=1 Tax=Actibacterium sp. TaxID=1872125 RepID=UPI0035652AAC
MTTRQDLEKTVIAVLEETVQDWELELEAGLESATRLIEDLAFESIDVVQFAVALEQALDRKGLPFEQLFIQEGNYVDDVTVAQVVDFLAGQIAVTA